jgi:hypothetical protein
MAPSDFKSAPAVSNDGSMMPLILNEVKSFENAPLNNFLEAPVFENMTEYYQAEVKNINFNR